MKVLKASVICMAVLLVAAQGGQTLAQPTIDGTASAGDGYGLALSTQNTNTQYGNSTGGDLIATSPGGSEIDQVFAVVSGGRLYVTVTGNLEQNFNKLEIFIDSDSGGAKGVSMIDSITPNVPLGVDPFSGGAMEGMDGLTFDSGFTADYYLTFTNGGESVGASAPPLGFWATSVHYADLTQGAGGAVVAAGFQLAPQGQPNVLRGPLGPDFNSNFNVDGADFLTWQRGAGTLLGATKPDGDANGDGAVDALDLGDWESRFGTNPGLGDFSFVPSPGGISTTDLIGPALPGLSQGQLIDKNYALGAGGCTADTTDGNAGCVAAELEFALDVDSNDPTNLLDHRNFENTIGLELALDNSNAVGVDDNSGTLLDYTEATTGNPGSVLTGIEFSISLAQIGNPTGDILLTALVTGGHNNSSNQFSGVGILQGNLGDFSASIVDLNTIAGNQYVTITNPLIAAVGAVPEPSSLALMALSALACGIVGRRRRR